MVVVQAPVQEHGAINIEDQANDPMEEDNDSDKVVEEDGTNKLIQETFNNFWIDDDENKYDDRAFDLPLLERETKTLYEGSKTPLLFAVLLLVSLKAVNDFSNTYVIQLLRFVIYFVTLSTKKLFFSLFLMLVFWSTSFNYFVRFGCNIYD